MISSGKTPSSRPASAPRLAGSAGRHFTGTFAAFALAAVYGGTMLALHRATRTSHLPLGPFILIGTLAAMLVATTTSPARASV